MKMVLHAHRRSYNLMHSGACVSRGRQAGKAPLYTFLLHQVSRSLSAAWVWPMTTQGMFLVKDRNTFFSTMAKHIYQSLKWHISHNFSVKL